MNKIIKWIIDLYILPLQRNKEIHQYAKERLKTNYLTRTIELLIGRINVNACIIDIGAYEGNPDDSTVNFALAFPQNNVYAFEPYSKHYNKLTHNIKKFKNVQAFKIALLDEEKEKELYITYGTSCSSLLEIDINEITKIENWLQRFFYNIEKEKIQTETLDDFVKKKGINEIAVIKVDTQGTELNVLKGAIESLKKTLWVTLEMSNHNTYKCSSKYYEVDQFLRENGFSLFDFFPYRYSRGRIFEWDAIYVNNNTCHS